MHQTLPVQKGLEVVPLIQERRIFQTLEELRKLLVSAKR